MSEYKTYPGTLFDYTAGAYCGVLVTESVMRRLAGLWAKHSEAVGRILADEADRGNVFPSMWTLHYPDGVQTTVRYIDTSDDVRRRIQLARRPSPTTAVPLAFIAGSMKEARAMADARHAEQSEAKEQADE